MIATLALALTLAGCLTTTADTADTGHLDAEPVAGRAWALQSWEAPPCGATGDRACFYLDADGSVLVSTWPAGDPSDASPWDDVGTWSRDGDVYDVCGLTVTLRADLGESLIADPWGLVTPCPLVSP